MHGCAWMLGVLTLTLTALLESINQCNVNVLLESIRDRKHALHQLISVDTVHIHRLAWSDELIHISELFSPIPWTQLQDPSTLQQI